MASTDEKKAMSAENGVALAEWLKSKMGGVCPRYASVVRQRNIVFLRWCESL